MKTYRELMRDLESLKKEIDTARDREARLIAEQVLALLAERGVPIAGLRADVPAVGQNRRTAKPKYWDPETGATWSGRGRMPHWLRGKDPAQFLLDRGDDSPPIEHVST